jgi:L-ascorbate metabolism protein UlaG (beta-lactamase superfamily)
MKIKHYLYNAFTISEGDKKIAIDPGQNLWMFNKHSLIPESEWKNITHILITHGDPDHFVYAIPMAKVSGATVICGDRLYADFNTQGINNTFSLDVDKTLSLNGVNVKGLKAHHGPLPVNALGGMLSVTGQVKESNMGGQEIFLAGIRVQKIENPMEVYSHGTVKLLFGLIRLEKDNLDFARGAIGYHIQIKDKSIVNLGDSLLRSEWSGLKPDVLMIPIGGDKVPNTMNVGDAIEAVRNISPKIVIPCHYNVPYSFIKNVNPADDRYFQTEVEKMGIECRIMNYGEETEC